MTNEEHEFVHNYIAHQSKQSAANIRHNYRKYGPSNSKIFKRDPLRHQLSY